jgi:hypothetical protein
MRWAVEGCRPVRSLMALSEMASPSCAKVSSNENIRLKTWMDVGAAVESLIGFSSVRRRFERWDPPSIGEIIPGLSPIVRIQATDFTI